MAPDERTAVVHTIATSLLGNPPDEETLARRAGSWEDGDWLVAWDGDRCAGHAGAFHFDTTVPGGARLPTAGVTRVGVLPTHTRRGLLTQLLVRLLRESAERGQVLSSLRASETPIYGRFGFGLAGDVVATHVTRELARPLRRAGAPGSMRLLRRDELFDVLPAVYERAARHRVGTIGRPRWYWERLLERVDVPTSDDDAPGRAVAVHTSVDGVDDGFVRYAVSWDEGFAENWRGGGKIHDLWGADADVERALWQYLLDLDLVTTWRAAERPVDEPIRRAFRDHRGYETRQRFDEQWVRLLDVDAALRRRTFGPATGGVRIRVSDPLLPTNDGTWEITAAGVEPATGSAAPDVDVDITTLGAAYLGGVSWFDLAASGELEPGDRDPDVLARLDALFRVAPAPFCGSDF